MVTIAVYFFGLFLSAILSGGCLLRGLDMDWMWCEGNFAKWDGKMTKNVTLSSEPLPDRAKEQLRARFRPN